MVIQYDNTKSIHAFIYSLKLWDFDSFDLWSEILVLQSISLKCIVLHFNVVECAYCLQVWSFLEFDKLILSLVKVKDLLDTVKMLSDVMLVLVDSESSFDLIFVHFLLILN